MAGGGVRRLEIGSTKPREGFESLNVIPHLGLDHVCDASRQLPFSDDTFSVILASHVLEHIPWTKTLDVLKEWRRVLTPGGLMWIYVPDAVKIAETILNYEVGKTDEPPEPWKVARGCFHRWLCGRVYAYEHDGQRDFWQWHHAIFTPKSLAALMAESGLGSIKQLPSRKKAHGWIEFGMEGKK